MGLIVWLLKLSILVLDLRDTYGCLNVPDLNDLGKSSKQVIKHVRSQDSSNGLVQKQVISRRRIGSQQRKIDVRNALYCLFVWNLSAMLEPIIDRTVSWFIPFYDSVKTLFLLWMLFTRSFGASILFQRIVLPTVKPYEPLIDQVASIILALTNLSIHLATKLMAKTMDNWQCLPQVIFGRIRSVNSCDTSPPPSSDASNPPPVIVEQQTKNTAPDFSLKDAAESSKASKASKSRTIRIPQRLDRFSVPSNSQGIQALEKLPVPQQSPSVSSKILVKSDPTRKVSEKDKLEPPPSPPSTLRSFALIPGVGTVESNHSSITSPQPKLPGSFNFAFSPQVSAYQHVHGFSFAQGSETGEPSRLISSRTSHNVPTQNPSVFTTKPTIKTDQKRIIVPPPVKKKSTTPLTRKSQPTKQRSSTSTVVSKVISIQSKGGRQQIPTLNGTNKIGSSNGFGHGKKRRASIEGQDQSGQETKSPRKRLREDGENKSITTRILRPKALDNFNSILTKTTRRIATQTGNQAATRRIATQTVNQAASRRIATQTATQETTRSSSSSQIQAKQNPKISESKSNGGSSTQNLSTARVTRSRAKKDA